MNNQYKPVIAVTMGDPAGIGPEIVVKALTDDEVRRLTRSVAIGDSRALAEAARIAGIGARVNSLTEPYEDSFDENAINAIDMKNVSSNKINAGLIDGECGKAAYEYIVKSIELALTGVVKAVATAPVNKESLQAGGINFIGHTEIFGELTGVEDPLTMFETRGMRIFFLTRHVSLRKACDMITAERIIDYVKRCDEALRQLGIQSGTIAIAGLNPHSGEHGLFGTEEMDAIEPAVRELRRLGYDAVGPVSADSVFHQALMGRYACVLSLYHDQGHIAAKTLDFERTISITCGMPILRTSVDHGTAYDIAGKNIASPVSMIEAILVAAKYAGA